LAGGLAWSGPLLAFGFQQAGYRVSVELAVAAGDAGELVGAPVDLGGRDEDVAAGGQEVEVVGGQVPVALEGAGEVGVVAAAGVRT
jgi:hypothetical protein